MAHLLFDFIQLPPVMTLKSSTLIFTILLFVCSSCQQHASENQPEETASNFSKAFYNFNYPEAKKWSTSSSLPYLTFLASNTQQTHLDYLKVQGGANVTVLTSLVDSDAQAAIVVCEIKNSLRITPINGKAEKITAIQDTLQLVKEDGKWLVRKDIPQQNEKQNHD